MKRIAAVASILLTSLAVTGTSVARGPERQSGHAAGGVSQPDQVIQWNQEVLQLLQVPGAQPATIHPTRTLAITQLAVSAAVDATQLGHHGYSFDSRGRRSASPDAATAAAARTVLSALLPSQQPAIEAFYQSSLAQIGSGRRVQRGIRVGERVADAILAARANDGANLAPTPYMPQPGPGEYQLTPPSFAPAAFTQTAHVTPFALTSASQFRPPAPPALTSTRYATDFNELKSLGRLGSTTRTADQTAIGRFWGAAPIWIVWNQIADQAGISFHNSLRRNAHMLALVDTALADGAIALYDAKYAYHRWRPITAITAADQGNPTTIADPTWLPLANTANDPGYPGAHAEFSQAAATVLEDFLGTDRFSFSLTNATTAITRSFQTFSGAADEAAVSRIYAGQHFRFDEDAGQALGRQVAELVVDHHRFGSRWTRPEVRSH
jgi:PAP2 superfamily